jgi:hypothetical protein
MFSPEFIELIQRILYVSIPITLTDWTILILTEGGCAQAVLDYFRIPENFARPTLWIIGIISVLVSLFGLLAIHLGNNRGSR